MRCFCACPYRKTGCHFSGTCVMHAFSTGMIRIGACADGNTGDGGIAAPHPQYLPREGTAPDAAALARGVFRPDAGREERGEA
jgi:hypothetical protein